MTPPPRPGIVRPLARRDIARAARWYERQSDGLGSRFVAAVDAALAVFPYGVYFVVRAGAVQVLAVTHGRRHPRRWQARARGV